MALGIQGGGVSIADEAVKWKQAFGSDEATRGLIEKVNDNFTKSQENIVKLIEKMSEKPKDDPQMAEMKTKLDELNHRLEDEREERHKLESDQLRGEIKKLSDEIRSVASGKQATDAYGIMSQGLSTLKEMGKDVKDSAMTLMTKGNAPVVTTNQKKALTGALGAEAEKALAAQKIGASVFNKPPAPAQSPATPPLMPNYPPAG